MKKLIQTLALTAACVVPFTVPATAKAADGKVRIQVHNEAARQQAMQFCITQHDPRAQIEVYRECALKGFYDVVGFRTTDFDEVARAGNEVIVKAYDDKGGLVDQIRVFESTPRVMLGSNHEFRYME
jgi:hypothetical protein